MRGEEWIDESLSELRAKGLERTTSVYPQTSGRLQMEGRDYLNFASNDYLNLSGHPRVLECANRALVEFGGGATSSRLVSGTLPLHAELEQTIAAHKGYDASLVFGTGYMANVGTITALVGRNDLVIADKLVHASMIDAVTLSRAELVRFKHNDVAHLELILEKRAGFEGRVLVMTESVFSMDGDLAPLREIAELSERFGVMLMVDEAHSTGIFGAGGVGLIAEQHLQPLVNVSMGTLSKAMGGYGGYVAVSKSLRAWLVHRARAFIYTTAPPPAQIGAALGAFEALKEDPSMGARLLENAAVFRAQLQSAGLKTLDSASQIVPVLIGENEKAVEVSQALRQRGIIASAIRPPTVPAGTARLRLSVTLAHSPADLAHAANQIADVCVKQGVIG